MPANPITQRLVVVSLVLLISIVGQTPAAFAQTVRLEYQGFTVWVSCENRGAERFEYMVKRDSGNLDRSSSFKLDPDVDENCQQTSSKAYSDAPFAYDRGHLVSANHLDHLAKGIRQSNFMTNILPQTKTMNRGAWKLTEEITECYRDEEDLKVFGGVVWGHNPDDDYFIESHGVRTPDYFWKVLVGENRAIAWIIPNSHGAKRSRLNMYLITIAELEDIIGRRLDVPTSLKHIKLNKSWKLPANCDKG